LKEKAGWEELKGGFGRKIFEKKKKGRETFKKRKPGRAKGKAWGVARKKNRGTKKLWPKKVRKWLKPGRGFENPKRKQKGENYSI